MIFYTLLLIVLIKYPKFAEEINSIPNYTKGKGLPIGYD